MRDIARSFASGRRITGLALTTLATVATVAALAPSAMAASSVTIKTAFENTAISLNTSDAVGYAFTNATSSPETVTFTDTLPAGVTLDNPVGTTVTSGSSSGCSVVSSTAAPGATAVTVTITVPNASGTVCTLSYSVVAATPSNDVALPDAFSSVSVSSGTVSETPGGLTVLSSPSLSFSAPGNGQSFALGQIADAAFSCTATDPKDSIDSFFGTDDEGNQIEAGAPIDTVDPGSHTIEVDCYSAAGGGDVSQTVSYTVGSYVLSAVKAVKETEFIKFKTTVPAGKLVAKVFYGKKVIGTTTVSRTARGPVAVTIKPTTAGKRLLARVKGSSTSLKLQVSFTPAAIGTGDQQITAAGATILSKTVKLPLVHATNKKKAKAASSSRKTAKRS